MNYKPGDQITYRGAVYVASNPKGYVPAWRGASCSPSKVAAYQGLRRPACHGGMGCADCAKVYNSRAAKKLRLKRAYA